jgi:hypothetical protein
MMSGFKINLSKSEIVHVGNVGDVEGLANIPGCRVTSLPMKYLGLPLGAPYRGSTIWNGIIEKITSVGVLEDALSIKGRQVDFDKSTLFDLPTYYLSLCPISVGVANRR